nr:MAG TPA: NMD3 family [Caudoviricetes sp.]
MIYRKCRICGCSLDPGEGNMCEECRDEQYMKQQREKAVRCMVLLQILDRWKWRNF